MTDFRSWQAPFRAMCPEPGPFDAFLVIFINGKRVGVQHTDEYVSWRWAAEQLAARENCQVKVLPMTGREILNFLGIEPEPPQPLTNLDPAFREQAIKNCKDVLRDCGNKRDRTEAMDMLTYLGVLQ